MHLYILCQGDRYVFFKVYTVRIKNVNKKSDEKILFDTIAYIKRV